MLGDGNMTGRTPTWVGHDDGTLQQIREYVAKHGCQVNVASIVWDRVVCIAPAGAKKTYCVEVQPSRLWVTNGVATGN